MAVSDDSSFANMFVCFILGVILGVSATAFHASDAIHDLRQQAIDAGVAKYKTNEVTGEIEFVFEKRRW